MAKKRPARVAAYPTPWAGHVTVRDVLYFARREFTVHTDRYVDAHTVCNSDAMAAEVRMLRGIVDKMDAFRRMMLRKWAAERAQQTEGKGVTN